MTHVLDISLVEVGTLLLHEEVDHVVVTSQLFSAGEKQALSLTALLGELSIHRVLIEAVDKLDKAALQKVELLIDCLFESLERLLH